MTGGKRKIVEQVSRRDFSLYYEEKKKREKKENYFNALKRRIPVVRLNYPEICRELETGAGS